MRVDETVAVAGPDWATIMTAVTTLATLVALVVTAVLAWRALADGRRTRHGQLLIDLLSLWADPRVSHSTLMAIGLGPEGVSSRTKELIVAMRASESMEPLKSRADAEEFATLWHTPNLIESMGVLESEGAISAVAINKMWGPQIVQTWNTWERPIHALRETLGQPSSNRYFEQLAAKLNDLPDTETAQTLGSRISSPAPTSHVG